MVEIPKDNFCFIENGPPGEFIVIPSFGVGNESWQDWKHRWLRSLHLNSDYMVISAGFPKFMNLGEGVGKYNVSSQSLLDNVGKDMVATMKIDGSLLIRFVQNGEVKWRIRNSLQFKFDASEIDYFCNQNPLLANPSFCPDISLLFEWVSPRKKIVIKYEHPQLFLIGGVSFDRGVKWWESNLRLLNMQELTNIELELGISIPDYYVLNSNAEVTRLIEDLQGNTSIEGFVIRFDDGQQLVKLKTEHYRTLHALRSCLTTAMLIDLWLQWGKPTFSEYMNLFDKAYDYETWQWAMPGVSSMYDGIKTVKKIHSHIVDFVGNNSSLSRKDFALLAQRQYDGQRLSACFTLLDGKSVNDDFWKKMIMQNCKQIELRMFKQLEVDDA